ncbi:hypothetical protein I302_107396 [Kwoniella bestiolae CBS 10118]|uniref:Uncharacterized protein n=1 Tax=Kwoniella bestiolae CBS 10118 TaxID=1296100 RepID=A0A1B9FYP7_9TREE|nr:hypothetical protein I302_06866 [Kwoniella bestiolae CBS 10118]OCF23880.1 hypothetical protein I302_06866 [Kwoniella bestiolae CBS 10118]
MTSITSPTNTDPKPPSKISPQRPTRRSTIAPSSKLTSATPNNTLISKPIAPIGKRTHTLPNNPSGTGGGGVLINAASKFMHINKNAGFNHATTPGNTLSSLEQITNRIANNLGGIGEGTDNRIAPSYERNFRAGLGDLTRRLSSPNAVKSPASPVMSPTTPSSMMFNEPNSLLRANEWPTSFSDLDAATNSLRSDRTDLIQKSPEKGSKAEEGR